MKVTILGCGSSSGVPVIGGNWGNCDPNNPKNRRRRPSILVESGALRMLVDTSPDLRAQLLDAGVERIDAVLYTHEHADHLHGIDELRVVRRLMGRNIEVFAVPELLERITRRFGYLFSDRGELEDGLYRPVLDPRPIAGRFRIGDLEVVPFDQDHGICATTGFRFGRFAYSTDVVELGEDAFAALAGVEVWVVDCLRDGEAHPTHAHLDRTLDWIRRVAPRHAVLTHMNHQADYEDLRSQLPAGVEPAYDGMTLEIPD
jgi:phosphoribosyl 1,2-cyclic phosphate phosphodiesterase